MASKEKANKKDVSKNKKSFFKDFKAELKKVVWPTPKQLVNNTIAVITIVIITGIIVFALDFVFNKINTKGIDKIKESISTLDSKNNETSDSESTEDSTASDSVNVTTDEGTTGETEGTTEIEGTEVTTDTEGTEASSETEATQTAEGTETTTETPPE